MFSFSRVLRGSAETGSWWSEAWASRAAAALCPGKPEFRPSLGPKAAPCTHTRALESPTSEVTSVRIVYTVYILIVLWLFTTVGDLQHNSKEVCNQFDFIKPIQQVIVWAEPRTAEVPYDQRLQPQLLFFLDALYEVAVHFQMIILWTLFDNY